VLLGEDQWTWLETLLTPPATGKTKRTLTQGEEENRDNDPVVGMEQFSPR
jgi:hypothetical protein